MIIRVRRKKRIIDTARVFKLKRVLPLLRALKIMVRIYINPLRR